LTGQDRNTPRDRDAAGRPRNARPRDGLGRPLARSAPPRSAAPGYPAPADDVPHVPDEQAVSPAQAADLGGRLLAEGRPFHAHEVFEAAWKSAAGQDRELWRGLAQIAVGLTHARRGNARGAVALLRRGAAHVAGSTRTPGVPSGIDAGFVAATAAEIAGRIERDGLAAAPDELLRLRLSRQDR
jgi:hypothetical protein